MLGLRRMEVIYTFPYSFSPEHPYSWSYRPDFSGHTDQALLVIQTRLYWSHGPDFPDHIDQTYLIT